MTRMEPASNIIFEELNVNEILKDYKNVRIVNGPIVEYNNQKISLVSRKFESLNSFLEYLQDNLSSLMLVWKIIPIEKSDAIIVRCANL